MQSKERKKLSGIRCNAECQRKRRQRRRRPKGVSNNLLERLGLVLMGCLFLFSGRNQNKYVALAASTNQKSSQDSQQQQQQQSKTDATTAATENQSEMLHSMSDIELEKICTDRGFELIKDELDEATGEIIVFTHQDYVEAARQCLSIQEQMEEVVRENPELMKELEDESNRLLEEKERLEAYRKQLESELEQAQEQDSDVIAEVTTTTDSTQESKNDDEPSMTLNLKTNQQKESTKAAFVPPHQTIINEKSNSLNDNLAEYNFDQDDNDHQSIIIQKLGRRLDRLVIGSLPTVVRPAARLVGRVLIRLVGDGHHLVKFIRRQIKALSSRFVKHLAHRRQLSLQDRKRKQQEQEENEDNQEDDNDMKLV